ncbi:hypothetical protein ES705_05386 [subsurface metagenome]
MNNNRSNQEFKTGDTVELKSGGPPMTIVDYAADGKRLRCQWFVGEKLEEGFFTPGSLQLVVVKPHKKGTVKYRDL